MSVEMYQSLWLWDLSNDSISNTSILCSNIFGRSGLLAV